MKRQKRKTSIRLFNGKKIPLELDEETQNIKFGDLYFVNFSQFKTFVNQLVDIVNYTNKIAEEDYYEVQRLVR